MLKILIPAAVAGLLMGVGSTSVMAQGACTGTLKKSEIDAILATTTCICGAPGASRPSLEWNETHTAGSISELGLANTGSGAPVGTYSTAGDNGNGNGDHGTITYNYTGGPSFTWVIDNAPVGTTYRFCSPGGHTTSFLVNIKPGTCTPNC